MKKFWVVVKSCQRAIGISSIGATEILSVEVIGILSVGATGILQSRSWKSIQLGSSNPFSWVVEILSVWGNRNPFSRSQKSFQLEAPKPSVEVMEIRSVEVIEILSVGPIESVSCGEASMLRHDGLSLMPDRHVPAGKASRPVRALNLVV